MARVLDTAQHPEGVQPRPGRIRSQGFARIPKEVAVQRRRADGHRQRYGVPGGTSDEAHAR